MLKKILHLSDQGAQTIKSASLWLTLFNLATLLPVILLALIADDMIASYFTGDMDRIPLWGYWGIAFAVLTVMFLTYKVAYHI